MVSVALVTGASRGIGLAVARALASAGFAVGGVSRSMRTERSSHFAPDCEPTARIYPHKCDVTSLDDIEQTVAQVEDRLGPIRILVNCAGVNPKDALLLRLNADDARLAFETNTIAPLMLSKVVARSMLRRRHEGTEAGCIVNIGSIVGSCGNVGQSAYAASKGGLEAATLSMAKELGPRGIRVNMVSPGFIATDMTSEGTLGEAARARAADMVSLQGRFGTPEEVAQAVVFLTAATYVHGHVLRVDGGLRM